MPTAMPLHMEPLNKQTRRERLGELLQTLKDKKASPDLIESIVSTLENLSEDEANELIG